jgi:hypothetical protein
MGDRQQSNAVFVVGYDSGHVFARRAAIGLIELRFASPHGSRILRLQ